MKRSYGGQRRVVAKRRRTTYRRRSYRKRSQALSSQKGNFGGTLYRRKLVPYRKYKNQLYRSLKFKEAHRSIRSNTSTITTSTLTASQKQWAWFLFNDNFYESAGGYTGSSTFSTDKIIIKGGMYYSMIRNTGTVPMKVEFGLIRVLDTLYSPDLEIDENAGDLSTLAGFGQSFKLISKMRKHILEPGDQCQVSYKIPFKVINDIGTWNTNVGKTAIVWSASSSTPGALSYLNERGHNLTFCADTIA